MIFNQTDFDAGIQLGTDRARNKLNNPSLNLEPKDRTLIRNALTIWPHEVSGRFVELFVELATIAGLARSSYQEPDLRDDELEAFLATSSSFFNSFKHK